MQGGRTLEAELEWITIESDLGFEENGGAEGSHNWNLVAPRADVMGRIRVLDGTGTEKTQLEFRGTGYHDHNHDTRWLPEAVRRWQWGRVHFHDTTAVFYDFEPLEGERVSRLITVRNRETRVDKVRVIEGSYKRDVFGLAYPASTTFVADDGLKLVVRNPRPVDSSFFYLRFVNDSTLVYPDGTAHAGKSLTELLAPKALKYRWLDWLVDMRIGRDGKGALLR
jgi:carotenoid 1,2-hydratase